MNCPECNTPVRVGARFCKSCGITLINAAPASAERRPVGSRKRAEELPPSMTTTERPSPAQIAKLRLGAEGLIDDFLREGGVQDPAAQTDEEGRRHFTFGSARCRAAILEDDGALYLHADAYVMDLPSDKELIVPLMRELLEINLMLRGAVRIGIGGEVVIAMAIRPVIEMQREEFINCIVSVMSVADDLDDALLAKYGGTAKQREPAKP